MNVAALLDYQVGLLGLAVLGLLWMLLAPVPVERKPTAPTEDTTHTRRLP